MPVHSFRSARNSIGHVSAAQLLLTADNNSERLAFRGKFRGTLRGDEASVAPAEHGGPTTTTTFR